MALTLPDMTIAAQAHPSTMQDALAPISSLMNLRQQQQQVQGTDIQLQKAMQANHERVLLQNFTSDPNNWQTDGQIDMSKINAAVPKIAPLTGGEYIGKMTGLAAAQTQASQAKLQFTNSERTAVGQLYGVLGRAGVTDPAVVSKELDNLKAQYPDNPQMSQYIDAAKVTLGHLQPGPGVSKQLITNSQALLSPDAQQGALSPQASLTNTGGALNETITQPAVGGNAPSVSMTGRSQPLTLSPSEQSIPATDAQGRPYTIDRNPQGQITGLQGVGASQPILPPSGESMSTLPEVQKIRTDANAAAAAAPGMLDNAKNIIELADQMPQGKWGGWTTELASKIGYQANDNAATIRQRLVHFMALQSAQAAQTMGLGTDASRAVAEAAASGSQDWSADAIKATARKFAAYVKGSAEFNKGLESYLASPQDSAGQWGARQFKNAWSQNFDPVAMELLNARETGDTADYQRLIKANRSNPQFIQKVKNLSLLMNGQIPK